MPASETQRRIYRDKFRSLHNEAFQAWFESLLNALHPPGDFQAIRKTAGDGGLDGFVISSQLVYQAYAPARIGELRDSEMAAKIRTDFAKAHRTLGGRLKVWTFVHNHPEAKIGKQSAAAISGLMAEHPGVEVSILDIDSLWEKLSLAPDTAVTRLFGPAAGDDLHAKLLLAEDYVRSSESTKAEELFKEVFFAAASADHLDSKVTALLGLFVLAMNRRDPGAAEEYLKKAEGLDKLKDVGLQIHVLRAKANLLDHRRDDEAAEAAYRVALAVPITASDAYVEEALVTTKVDFALFFCRTKRPGSAESLIRECEAFIATSSGKPARTVLPHVFDALISHALCVGDMDATARGIEVLEEKASTQALAHEFGLLLERLGQRALHLKAYDSGVLCCQAALRLAHKAGHDDDAVAAQHAEVLLLCEKGDLDTAKALCGALLTHVRSGSDRVLHVGVADLWARIAHKLGDYETAASAAEEALGNAGDNLMAAVGLRHNLGQCLCDAGHVEQGLEHAKAAYTLAKKIGADTPFLADLLFLIAHAACLLGDWAATDTALADLGSLPEWSEEFERRRRSLLARIEGCREIRRRIEVFANDPIPLATAGTSTSNTVWDANAAVIAALIDWWEEAPSVEEVPPGYNVLPEAHYPKNLAVLYDYWGRGNMARVLLNLRGFDHTFTLTLEVRTLDEVKRAVRVFALFTDVLILLWKGPLWSRRVVPIVPAFNGVEGGAGYIIFPTDPDSYQRSTGRSGDWFPAVGYGSFLPDDIMLFLREEALPLLKLGRLFVVPASAVGCMYEGHGPFESLFAELCAATPTLRSDPSNPGFPIGWVPYFPNAPLQAIADLICESPEALRRLRLLLMKRTRELRSGRQVVAASEELETEIVDAFAQMKDFQLRIKRKSGWDQASEAIGDSAVKFSREDLLGAAWRNAAGLSLYSYGRSQEASIGAEWMPVLTLQDLGYRWRVEPTDRYQERNRQRKGPEPDEAVGSWLVPRGHDVRVAAVRARDDESG